MRDRCSRLGVAIGLVALCSGLTLAGRPPVEAQTVDVLSLPGDPPGSKVAFHRRMDTGTGSGDATAHKHFTFPSASEVRIETVTASCSVPATQVVSVRLTTYIEDVEADAFIVSHVVALARVGTYITGPEEKPRAVYEGTHYVRLLAGNNFSLTGPPEFDIDITRGGDEPELPGSMYCTVTVAGYTTPGGRKRP